MDAPECHPLTSNLPAVWAHSYLHESRWDFGMVIKSFILEMLLGTRLL